MLLKIVILTTLICLNPMISLAQGTSNKKNAPDETKLGKVTSKKELKILFSSDDFIGLDPKVELLSFSDWKHDKKDSSTTAEELLSSGWSLLQIIPIGAGTQQHYWVFVR